MELVIRPEHFRILLCSEHYHQNQYHTMTFVRHRIVQTVKIDAPMPTFTIVILKFGSCILTVFDFRGSKIGLLVCVFVQSNFHTDACYLFSILKCEKKTCNHANNFLNIIEIWPWREKKYWNEYIINWI